jgi:4-diphosphocytidyl-2-C-methyl-D-erythritol kinase
VIRVEARAKLNLRLVVLAREASGYHQIETIFCRTDHADMIELAPSGSPGVTLSVQGAEDVGPDEDNLAARAARAFYAATDLEPQLAITLHKRVPAGAGLGGGSSDAAATLRALNGMHDHALDDDALLALGARLGSDVPFFLADTPMACAWGRGERMLALAVSEPAPALVAVPARAVSTADAYRRLSETLAQEETGPRPSLLAAEDLASWRGLARVAHNDFERVVLPDVPALVPALALLRARGAIIARMTGSGSAIFGVFEDTGARDRAHAALAAVDPALRLYPMIAGV